MDAKRSLLLGLLALEHGSVTPEQLAGALRQWCAAKSRRLDAILRELELIDAPGLAALERAADDHLALRDGRVELSLAALAISDAARRQLLRIDDCELRAVIERLSSAHVSLRQDIATQVEIPPSAEVSGPGETAAFSTETSGVPARPDAQDDSRFRILRPHAKGGLGEVFLAQDKELNREVALKEIQLRHAGHEVSRARFLLEAEVTGALEHPGIVPVYALGTYDDGRPYYAMRFIRGSSFKDAIEQFHDTRSKTNGDGETLDLRQLLRRFIDVCNAIEYAHSRGVLHRDLKPANVMLGKYGETLVVDWGLAKTLGREELPGAEERQLFPMSGTGGAGTVMGSAMGTPSYMSPEQARGDWENLGPTSDVYSLGATLYEILTGVLPFEGDLATVLENVKSGRFAAPRKRQPLVPKPLEAICRRAMSLEPADRYPSARELADDVDHWLADEAVAAYREPWRERLLRWGRRHKTWTQAAAAAIATIALVATIASVLINNSRRDEALARHSAEASFLQARRTVDDFFTRVSESKLLNVPGLQPLRKELFLAALEYYRGFIAQRANDPSVRGELAETYYRVGLIAGEIGSKSDALESLEGAREIQESLRSPGQESAESELARANTCNAIGNLKQQMGELNDALALFNEAKAIRESLVARMPGDAQVRRKLANSYNNIAVIEARLGNTRSAAEQFEIAGKMRAELARENPASAVFLRDLAQGLFNDALHRKEGGEMDAARASFQKAIETYQSLVTSEPRAIDHRRELAWTYRACGDLQAATGHPIEAIETYEQAREIAEALSRQNPLLVELQADVAAIYANLGRLNRQTAELPQAVDWYTRACAIREQLVAADPAAERFRLDLASSRLHLGMAHLDVAALEPARASFEAAITDYRALGEKNPNDGSIQDALAQTLRNLGLVDRAEGDPARALAAFQETREIYQRLSKNSSAAPAKAGLADALVNIAVDERALGQMDAALAAARQAVDVQAEIVRDVPQLAEYQYMRAEGLYALGLLQLQRGEYSESLVAYQSVLAIVKKLLEQHGENLAYRSMLGTALDKQAVVLWLLDRRQEAIESAEQATTRLQAALEGDPRVVQYRLSLSDNLFNRAKFERGRGSPEAAVALARQRKKLWPANGGELYKAAGELALSAQAVGGGETLSATQQNEREAYLDEAIQTLKDAVAAGFTDLKAVAQDPQLDVLHGHAGFQRLLEPAK